MKRLLALILSLCLAAALAGAEEAPAVTARVLEVEKYGHALLDMTIEDFEAAGFALGDVVTVAAGSFEGDMPYLNGYYVDRGETLLRAYPGQTNIAVCINYGKFAETAGVEAGSEVTIRLKEKAGALALQEINNLVYTDVRGDYPSDEAFANYRPVALGGIAEGRLYRSASPVNPKYQRTAYAYRFFQASGIRAVMNLANTEAELAEYFAQPDFAYAGYQALHEEGFVIALGLPADFAADDFVAGIVRGLTFLSQCEPPYLVHCTEGKDRAGYACMMIEALMGASYEEITADYMQSFVNYYGVEPGSEKYQLISQKNVLEMLKEITGSPDPASQNLAAAAEAYLLAHGMRQEDVQALQVKLGE